MKWRALREDLTLHRGQVQDGGHQALMQRLVRPKSIHVVFKPNCPLALKIATDLATHVKELAKPSEHIMVSIGGTTKRPLTPDLVVTVGGDGTLLHTAAQYPRTAPLFLPVAAGTLGFMLPFSIGYEIDSEYVITWIGVEHAHELLQRLFKSTTLRLPIMHRMRLEVCIKDAKGKTVPNRTWTALNEVNVHRGSSPSLARMECLVDGFPLTNAIADG